MKPIKLNIQIDKDSEMQKKELIVLVFILLAIAGFAIGFLFLK